MTPPPTSLPSAVLLEERNLLPPSPRHIHLMGICGVGMASLAGMLHARGLRVTGSDQTMYPPMSTFLHSLGIPLAEGYRPENLHPEPDLVIVGNVISAVNPEAVALSRLRIPYLSFPQALRRFALEGKRPLVVAGTHGKTTSTALLAWVLETAGLSPGFMIGGMPTNFGRGFQLGSGPYFVVEGDEYDTAFFDKGPKFLHYAPWCAILTSIEFDHADIYRDLDHVVESFRRFLGLLPREGILVANGNDPVIAGVIRNLPCATETFGASKGTLWQIRETGRDGSLFRVEVLRGGKTLMPLWTPLYGRHNFSNLLAVTALASFLGVPPGAIAEAARTFKGVKRRQEILGEPQGILLMEDFAHHPTAVRLTLHAVAERYAGRRILAVFEPRSNTSRRNIFQDAYAQALTGADLVFVPEPSLLEKIPPGERFSSRRLAEDLQRDGRRALSFETTTALLHALLAETRPGDVVLFMSNGGFEGLPARVLEALS